jgi:hypothetical protein
MAALVLISATLEEDHVVWRGVRMGGDLRLHIAEAAKGDRTLTGLAGHYGSDTITVR